MPSPFRIAFRDLGLPGTATVRGVEHAIRDGRLLPGDRLPPVRRLAGNLNISVTTVTAAFDLLSDRKLVHAEVGRGTFVAHHTEVGEAAGATFSNAAQRRRSSASCAPWRRRR